MAYRVELKPAARRGLLGAPREAQIRLRDALRSIGLAPRGPGTVKLAGSEGLWRVRVGDYRILSETGDASLLVLVIRLGHRREVYRIREAPADDACAEMPHTLSSPSVPPPHGTAYRLRQFTGKK